MALKSKLPDVGTTIFTLMTNLSNDHRAINLSQGFPDFDADPDLLELVDRYLNQGVNQYAPMQGVAGLREKISRKVNKTHHHVYVVHFFSQFS